MTDCDDTRQNISIYQTTLVCPPLALRPCFLVQIQYNVFNVNFQESLKCVGWVGLGVGSAVLNS